VVTATISKYLACAILGLIVSLGGCAILEQTASPSNQIYLGRSRLEVSAITDKIIRVDGVKYDLGDRTLDAYTCKRSSDDDKQIMYCETRVTKECICAQIF
jgi:hypothetical protein